MKGSVFETEQQMGNLKTSPGATMIRLAWYTVYKKLSYCRETALHGALVLAKSGRMEMGDDILRTI